MLDNKFYRVRIHAHGGISKVLYFPTRQEAESYMQNPLPGESFPCGVNELETSDDPKILAVQLNLQWALDSRRILGPDRRWGEVVGTTSGD